MANDPSLVSYWHLVGYHRSPGKLASRITSSIGECRMSLRSTIVVKHLSHGDRLAPSILPSTSVSRSGLAQLRLSIPDRVSHTRRRRRGLLGSPSWKAPAALPLRAVNRQEQEFDSHTAARTFHGLQNARMAMLAVLPVSPCRV